MRFVTTRPATSCKPRIKWRSASAFACNSRAAGSAQKCKREKQERESAEDRTGPRPERKQRIERRLLFRRGGYLQHRQKRLLGDIHAAHALHAPLAFFLFLEQLALARDVAAIALGENVFAYRADGLPGDHAAANGRLQRNLKHLPRDQFA